MLRSLAGRVIVLLALVVVGAAIAVVARDDTTGVVIGFALSGTAAVLLVSLAFYEVGRSEDRARELGR